MNPANTDRRRYPRSRRSLPVVADNSGPGVMNHIDNISGSGVLCHTIKPIPMMTKMGVVIELPKPHEQRVECEGIVVRCEPDEQGDDHFKVAILYTKIEDKDHQAIVDFVEHDIANDDSDI